MNPFKDDFKATESVLFIEGDRQLTNHCKNIKNELNELGVEVLELCDVYNNISKLSIIKDKNIKKIIIQTVGGNKKQMFDYAKEFFIDMKYTPTDLYLVLGEYSFQYFKDVFKELPTMNVWDINPFSNETRKLK